MTKPGQGYYCLIQYCPDPGRAECINVGVHVQHAASRMAAAKTLLAFSERGADFDTRRAVRALGGPYTNDLIAEAAHDLACLLVNTPNLDDSILKADRGSLRIFGPRSMLITDLQGDCDRLFAELVEAPK